MGMTIAEKILAAHAGKESVSPKEIVDAKIDYVMVNDVTGLPAFEVFEEFDTRPILEKSVLIQDHYVPNKDVASAEQAKSMRVVTAHSAHSRQVSAHRKPRPQWRLENCGSGFLRRRSSSLTENLANT
jgi:homoaconitase/3-isopropylmalate dehydratase large subunit